MSVKKSSFKWSARALTHEHVGTERVNIQEREEVKESPPNKSRTIGSAGTKHELIEESKYVNATVNNTCFPDRFSGTEGKKVNDISKLITSYAINPLELRPSCLCIIAGKSGSGKTNLLCHLIDQNTSETAAGYHEIVVMCPTAEYQSMYSFIPKKRREHFIITDPKEEDLKEIVDRAKSKPGYRICLIIDDCISILNMRNSKSLDFIATAATHHNNLTTFCLVQKINVLSTIIRDNANYLFVTKIKSNSIKSAWEIVDGFEKERDLRRYLEKYCVTSENGKRNAVRFDLDDNDFNQNPVVFNLGVCEPFKVSF